MCLLCIEIAKGKMTFREIGVALGEFHVPQEHEEDLEKVILENISIETLAKELGEDLEFLSEAFIETDCRQFFGEQE